MTKKTAWPKTLGACVDLLYRLNQSRLEKEREAAKIKEDTTALKDHLLEKFSKDDLRGGRGKIASVRVDHKEVPTLEDDARFYKFLKKTGHFELLQRRLNEKAVKERWESGETVPGVGKFTVIKVTPHKLGAKDRA